MRLPEGAFYLFGMGGRRKLLYKAGVLRDALTGEKINQWEVAAEQIEPEDYSVRLRTKSGVAVTIAENERGVHVTEGHARRTLTAGPLKLPRFEKHTHGALLRRLHHEILINIVKGFPVPNLWVYPKPWYRDAAMMLMCLQKTDNLALVRDWILRIREPFDRNNAGHEEPDNLGQALYMVSLVSDRSHPLVSSVMQALPRFVQEDHVIGLSDSGEHPVYQTKWLKYGLRALNMPDPYKIPGVKDTYASLFWMDYRENHEDGFAFSQLDEHYPYLSWAEAHFHNADPPAMPHRGCYPLSWEARASQADYAKMGILSEEYAQHRISVPHAWHAAEMFLYFWDKTEISEGTKGEKQAHVGKG